MMVDCMSCRVTHQAARSIRLACLKLCLMGLLMIPVISVEAALYALPEVFKPAEDQGQSTRSTDQAVLKIPYTSAAGSQQKRSRPIAITLGEPDSLELQRIRPPTGRNKAMQVGISRAVPAAPAVADWAWSAVTGGQAGQLLIISEQASRIRGLLQISQALPAGVEIRIYGTQDTTAVFGPYTGQDFSSSSDKEYAELWTPTLPGADLGIELFVPDGIDFSAIQLNIPVISHIVYDVARAKFKSGTTKAFQSCDVSIACAPAIWQETAKSVARYIYTSSDGNSYLCSGTLLADKDTTTQIPYFLTAAHCVADSNSTASMDFFWMERESGCGTDDAQAVQISGGAKLLTSRAELDSTLVQINNLPPSGVVLSGWSLEPLEKGTMVSGIHHALGNPKQYSNGAFNDYVTLSFTGSGYTAFKDEQGDFTQVNWSQGITAPGSSGSGLWATIDEQRLLKGSLVGGSSSCSNTVSPDEYSRLEKFYPFVAQWLGSQPLQGLLDANRELSALIDGVLLSRYMAGVRGADLLSGVTNEPVDLTELELRLSEAITQLDIDGDQATTAEIDGLLLTRYLLGLRNDALIAGIDLTDSPRNTAEAISEIMTSVVAGK